MKNSITILWLAALAAAVLTACEGPAGPQGIQGERGEKGVKGDTGERGETGDEGLSIVWQGERKTAPFPAYENWAYYNSVDKKSYIYDGERWQILVKDGEAGPQGPKGENGEKGDSLYLVVFNANGGIFSDLSVVKKISAEGNSPVAPPEEPHLAWGGFLGWYTQPEGGSLFDFTTPINLAVTLYARWLFDKNLLADWLGKQSGGGSEDDPLKLLININLDTGWQELLEVIEEAQKYVELDLSRCGMGGAVFNPGGIKAGKDKIVSIALPDKAAGIAPGNSEATSAFNSFSNLRSFSGANLAAIGAYAFYNCAKLNPDALPASVTSIGNYSFYKCTEMELTELPDGITSIGNHAFDGCTNLALTELPDGLTKINSYSFQDCKNLELIALPSGVTEIWTYAFSGCTNLALTELPPAVKTAQTNIFNGCSSLALTSLPETLTSIGSNTFSGCASLTEMTLHDKMNNIGNSAFSGCGNLEFFTCLAEKPPKLGTNVFSKAHSGLKIKVPAASIELYRKADNWSAIADKIISID